MEQAQDINGELLRLKREERGWAQSDLATRACMSVKQIRQIEEGGVSAFYSEPVKVAAAKKVAGLLGLSADALWVNHTPAVSFESEPVIEVEAPSMAEAALPEPTPAEPNSVVIEQTEPRPESAKPLLDRPEAVDLPKQETTASAEQEEEAKPKTSLWLIATLFGAALAVAAYMRPDIEPSAVVEPPPPLQIVPSEAAEAASAASAATEAASSAAAPAVVPHVAPSVAEPKVVASAAVVVNKPMAVASAPAVPAPTQAAPKAQSPASATVYPVSKPASAAATPASK